MKALQLFGFGAAAIVALFFVLSRSDGTLSRTKGTWGDEVNGNDRYIYFTTCGPYVQQRLTISYGVLIAKLMNRTMILPEIFPDHIRELYGPADFELFFQRDHFIRSLQDDVTIIPHVHPSFLGDTLSMDTTFRLHEAAFFIDLAKLLSSQQVVVFTCPLYSLDLNDSRDLLQFSWRVQMSLLPNTNILNHAEAIVESLQDEDKKLIYFHYRLDNHWIDHCRYTLEDGCYCDLEEVLTLIQGNERNQSLRFYVSGVDKSPVDRVQLLLKHFDVYTKNTLLPEKMPLYKGYIDLLDALDFEIALRSPVYYGSNLSLLSSFISALRELNSKPSFSYSTEQRQINKFHPSLSWINYLEHGTMTWVFSYNGENTEYIPYLKAAINSAIEKTTMRMVCMFDGVEDEISKWLMQKGVKVIFHKLSWESEIEKRMAAGNFTGLEHPTYSSTKGLTSTFMRTDMPMIMHEIGADFVLYTDLDVIFLQDIKPKDFATFPLYFASPPQYDMEMPYPCNVGVMLVNVPNMKATHSFLLKYILSSPNLSFPNGPTDQGALNTFYRTRMDTLPAEYNWRPYWPRNNDAKILHFEGPKPRDYRAYFQSKKILRPQFESLLHNCDQGADCHQSMKLFEMYASK